MVKIAQENDVKILADLAVRLYTDSTVEDLEKEFCQNILSEDIRFYLKYENDLPIGFAQVNLRYDYVEGSETNPVGYLEGIYIKEAVRGKGYAKELLKECETWAKSKGCKQFASDCEIDNLNSYKFHKAVDFEECNRIICFIKNL